MIEVKCFLYDKIVLSVYASSFEDARKIASILVKAEEQYDKVEFEDLNPDRNLCYVYFRVKQWKI